MGRSGPAHLSGDGRGGKKESTASRKKGGNGAEEGLLAGEEELFLFPLERKGQERTVGNRGRQEGEQVPPARFADETNKSPPASYREEEERYVLPFSSRILKEE